MSENNPQHHNQNNNSAENEDIALAKILQQQERAFLELRGGGESLSLSLHEHEVPPQGMTEDEELAWRLMREEETMFQQRMMAMAGLGPGTAAGPSSGGVTCDDGRGGGTDMDASGDAEEGNGMISPNDEHDPDDLTYEELTTLGDLAGTVACGLTEEQMDRLEQSTYGDFGDASADINRADDRCIVCQLDFEARDLVVQLPTCKHIFHDECLRPWLARKKTCPFCSVELELSG